MKTGHCAGAIVETQRSLDDCSNTFASHVCRGAAPTYDGKELAVTSHF